MVCRYCNLAHNLCHFHIIFIKRTKQIRFSIESTMAEEEKPPRPGEAALKNMQLLKSESSVFKVPKVPKQKISKKTKALDEELYVQSIAKIIQRDFFPDIEKLHAQNEFLEATENKNLTKLMEIARKYSGSRPPTEPYNSPATFDTPEHNRPFSPLPPTVRGQKSDNTTNSAKSKPKDITDNQSLDSFLARHTSEDNASYDRVIALEDRKRANKLSSQFEAEVRSIALLEAALALPSIDQQADQTERPHELDTWRYTARNHIMYVPERAASQGAPPKPELMHHNTRLKAEPFDHVKSKETISALARSQDATSTGKIGVDGTSVSTEKGPTEYGLVGTPSPRPGVGPDQSPLMTWGEIEGTPFRLDGGDTPLPAVGAGAAYRMLEGGARERIALQLAEQVAKRRRPTTPRAAPPTPSFRSNTERLASMSPAARKLAAKHLLSPRLRLTPNDVGVHHADPKRTPKRTPGSKRRLLTPTRKPGSSTPSNETQNITDNLLQINLAKRTRVQAADFFK